MSDSDSGSDSDHNERQQHVHSQRRSSSKSSRSKKHKKSAKLNVSDSDSARSHHRKKRKGKSKSWKSKLKKSSKRSIKKRRKQSSSAEDSDSDSSEASTGSNRPRSKLIKELKRLNQSGQQRNKPSGSFLGSEQIPSKASALIVTGIVKVQSTSCQAPILFSTTDSCHEFDEKISKDVLDNKYSSYSISYVCKGVDVLLTKST